MIIACVLGCHIRLMFQCDCRLSGNVDVDVHVVTKRARIHCSSHMHNLETRTIKHFFVHVCHKLEALRSKLDLLRAQREGVNA